ncbi:hypothetical protein AB9K35_09535 [Leisingera sp. XS_AS12]
MTTYLAELFAWIEANPGATATISAAIIAVCGELHRKDLRLGDLLAS